MHSSLPRGNWGTVDEIAYYAQFTSSLLLRGELCIGGAVHATSQLSVGVSSEQSAAVKSLNVPSVSESVMTFGLCSVYIEVVKYVYCPLTVRVSQLVSRTSAGQLAVSRLRLLTTD